MLPLAPYFFLCTCFFLEMAFCTFLAVFWNCHDVSFRECDSCALHKTHIHIHMEGVGPSLRPYRFNRFF